MTTVNFRGAKVVIKPPVGSVRAGTKRYKQIMKDYGVQMMTDYRGRKLLGGTLHALFLAIDRVLYGQWEEISTPRIASVNAVLAALDPEIRLPLGQLSFRANETRLLSETLFRFGRHGRFLLYGSGQWTYDADPTCWTLLQFGPETFSTKVYGSPEIINVRLADLMRAMSDTADPT